MRNRIDHTFRSLSKKKEKALIGFITAGHPTKKSLFQLVPLLEKAGLDLLEIGVPFSDPIADGPTIQASSHEAPEHHVNLRWILSAVRRIRRAGVRMPLILMSYCNPIYAMGISNFFSLAARSGVDGLIIPDMIPEEAGVYKKYANTHGVHMIFLVAPTTPKRRIAKIASYTKGFLYAVSVAGITGARKTLPHEVKAFLKKVRSQTKTPIALGFGLSTPLQVKQMAPYVDAVIVGSALIQHVVKSQTSRYAGAVQFVRSLKGALHAS